MNLKNLNGWQRLGIVVSVAWLVVVVLGTITGGIIPATRKLSNQLEANKAAVRGDWVQASIKALMPNASEHPKTADILAGSLRKSFG